MSQILIPLYDRVVVQRPESEGLSEGGIYIPDMAKEKPQEGVVVSIAHGRFNERGELLPLQVKPGDRVLFGKYAGTEFWVEKEQFLVVREEEIIGILREE